MAQESVELSKAVISSRNTEHPLAKNCPVNHLCTSRTAGREIDRSGMPMAWKKTTNAIIRKSAINRTHRRLTNIYFGTIKRQWVTITLI
jgi:hypothetical protein